MFEVKTNKQKLIKQIENLIFLLNYHGVIHWPDRLNKSLKLIKKDDEYGVTQLLSEFGGMGSLNDLWISSNNGHVVLSSSEEKLANIKLEGLRNKIYKLAKSLE